MSIMSTFLSVQTLHPHCLIPCCWNADVVVVVVVVIAVVAAVFFYFTLLNAQAKASPEDFSSSSYKKLPVLDHLKKTRPDKVTPMDDGMYEVLLF